MRTKEEGITLVALVVTIIAIIIVASVSINASIGENGIVTRAAEKKNEQEKAVAIQEITQAQIRMQYYELAEGDKAISLNSVQNVATLQRHLKGRINGTSLSLDGKTTTVFYENENGPYTLKINNETEEIETLNGYYIEKGVRTQIALSENQKFDYSLDGGKETDIIWIPVGDIDSFDLTSMTKNDSGYVTMYGFTYDQLLNNEEEFTLADAAYIVDIVDKSDEREVTEKVADYKSTMGDVAYPLGNDVFAKVAGANQDTLIVYVDENVPYNSTGVITSGAFSLGSTEADLKIEKLFINEGVITLHANTFKNFENLDEMVLPRTLINIPTDSFAGIEYLTKLYFNCEDLKTNPLRYYIDSTNGNYRVERGSELSKLRVLNLYIGSGVQKIPSSAFAGSFVEIVTLSSSVKTIESYAFAGSQLLRAVYFNNGIERIKNDAFYDCDLVTLHLPYTCKTIDYYAFRENPNLGLIDMPGVEKIDDLAFAGAVMLKRITFPETVKYIGANILSECTSLKQINWNCIDCEYYLNNIYLDATKRLNGSIYMMNYREDTNGYSLVEKLVIGDKVKKLPPCFCYAWSKIKEVYLPPSVEEIGFWAFRFTNIEKINLENVKVFGVAAFDNCKLLQNVNLKSAEVIEGRAFGHCYGFTEIRIHENLKDLYESAFCQCDNVQTLYWNAVHCEGHFTSVFWDTEGKSYDHYPFQWWDRETGSAMRPNIGDIRIGDKCEYLTGDLFRHNNDPEIVIPANVTYITPDDSIYHGTFCNCPDMRQIIVKKPEGSISGAPWSNSSQIQVLWQP